MTTYTYPGGFGEPQFERGLRLMESIIGGRWNPMILFALEGGPCRFSDLKSRIEFISDTELQRKLGALTGSGLVTRCSPEEDARRGEYMLTGFGGEIAHTLRHILVISQKHGADHEVAGEKIE
jgi:DNA-binding HxlR family transcriptional regulator